MCILTRSRTCEYTVDRQARAIGEKELRNKKGQWMYKLRTLRPASGLREDDGFYSRTERPVWACARDDVTFSLGFLN